MPFEKLSEKDLAKLKKKRSRQACLDVVARIEDAGVVVDLTKYPDTIDGFIAGIREYQELVPVLDETPAIDDEDKEQLSMTSESDVQEIVDLDKVKEAITDAQENEPEKEPEQNVEEEETTTEPEEPEEKEEPEEEDQPEPEVEFYDDGYGELPPYNPSPNLPDWRELMADTPEQFVRQTYIRLLEREPDPGGLSNYVKWHKSGMPREQIMGAIKSSDEYRKLQVMKKRAGKL